MNMDPKSERRGVVYIFWGEKAERAAERSLRSLRLHHPDIPVHCHRVTNPVPGRELLEKTRVAAISPFQTTLFLDVDTVVMGNLDYAFEQAERFGLACAINECPWMRRYGQPGEGEHIEYNTGVLFFTAAAAAVFEAWRDLANTTPSSSHWTMLDDRPRGLPFEDQAGFSRALRQCNFNPFVLPLNYNFRPMFFHSAFAPIKIWHDYRDPPEGLDDLSDACALDQRPVTYFKFDADANVHGQPTTPETR
jgi:hypothetical protein